MTKQLPHLGGRRRPREMTNDMSPLFPASKETQEIANQVSYIKWYIIYCYLTLHRLNSRLNKASLKCFQCIKLWHIVCHHLCYLQHWIHAIISRYIFMDIIIIIYNHNYRCIKSNYNRQLNNLFVNAYCSINIKFQ